MREIGNATIRTKIKRKAILIKLRENNKLESEKIFEQLNLRAFIVGVKLKLFQQTLWRTTKVKKLWKL